jgi:deazaflavin-dependent oxidoreductase (nitroreductase family)
VYYGSALFERFVPYEQKRRFQKNLGNPFGRAVMRWFPGWVVIETIGRNTGEPRRVPVGGRRIGDAVWFVAADPGEAAYVKNIRANPRVRVQLGGHWSDGVAHLLPGDDAKRRMVTINPLNGLFIRLAGREHLTIRVDLDPLRGGFRAN